MCLRFVEANLWKPRVPRAFIKGGPFKYIRHPVYVYGMSMWLAIAAMFGWWYFFLFILFIGIPIQIVRACKEEQVLLKAFGQEYEEYRRHSFPPLPLFKK